MIKITYQLFQTITNELFGSLNSLLRFIFCHCGVRLTTPHSKKFARRKFEAFVLCCHSHNPALFQIYQKQRKTSGTVKTISERYQAFQKDYGKEKNSNSRRANSYS